MPYIKNKEKEGERLPLNDSLIEIHFYKENQEESFIIASKDLILKEFEGSYEKYLETCFPHEKPFKIKEILDYQRKKSKPRKMKNGAVCLGSINEKEAEAMWLEKEAMFRKNVERNIELLDKALGDINKNRPG